ncbi:MAG: hypothetical protein ACRDFX_01150, partial [Chloroflexota bacterium]
VQTDYSATAISGIGATQSIAANDFTHPAAFLTSPFFTDKRVEVTGNVIFDGRTSWVLSGEQIAGVPVVPSLGDGWRIWVDKQTGIILRREYTRGGSSIGWEEFQHVAIDGAGEPHVLAPLLLPPGTPAIDPIAYARTLSAWIKKNSAGESQ